MKNLRPRFISISFDSHRKELFEKIRGEETYKEVLQNIENLIKEGIETHINSVVFKGINDTYEHLKEFALFFKRIGIPAENIAFDEFIPEGEGKNKEYYRICENEVMKNMKKVYEEIFSISPDKMKDIPIKNVTSNTFCGIGEEICYVNSNGNITLCPAMSEEKYNAGNVLEEDIKNIWENSKMFDYFRKKEYLKNCKCSDCKSLEKCFGGCKAKSMTFFGKFNAPDPWMCVHFDE